MRQESKLQSDIYRGEKSARIIAAEMGMGKRGEVKVREWAAIYSENGIEGFHLKKGNSHYISATKDAEIALFFKGF